MRCITILLLLHVLTSGCTADPSNAIDTNTDLSSMGCDTSNNYAEIDWNTNAVTLLEDREVASVEQVQGGTIYQPIYRVTFNGTAPYNIANGSLIALDGNRGFMGRVHNLQHSSRGNDGSIQPATAMVVSSDVHLGEAVNSLHASVTACTTQANGTTILEQGFRFGGVTIVAREGANVEDFQYSFDNTVLEFDPDIDIDIDADTQLGVDPLLIKSFRIRLSGRIELPYHIAAGLKAQGTAIVRGVVPTGVRFPAFVGPIPLWVELKAGIDLEFQGRGEFSLNAQGKAEAAFSLDAELNPQATDILTIHEQQDPSFVHEGSAETVADFHGAARIGVGIGVGVYLAGLVGPSVSIKPYLKLDGCNPDYADDPAQPIACTRGWDLSFGASALIGVEANELLPFKLAVRRSVPLFETPILSGSAH